MSDLKRQHLTNAAQLLDDQAKFCRKTMPESLKRVYLRFLAPLTPEKLLRAFTGWQFKSTRFPSVEELLESCGRSPKQQAEKNWLSLEMVRDRIADEVCREGGYLVSIRTLNHASEFNSGIAKRDLKARFVEDYSRAWLDWWSRGEIEHGETVLDFTPKAPTGRNIAEEEKPSAQDMSRLNAALSQIGIKVQSDKGMSAIARSKKGLTPINEDDLEF